MHTDITPKRVLILGIQRLCLGFLMSYRATKLFVILGNVISCINPRKNWAESYALSQRKGNWTNWVNSRQTYFAKASLFVTKRFISLTFCKIYTFNKYIACRKNTKMFLQMTHRQVCQIFRNFWQKYLTVENIFISIMNIFWNCLS